MKPQIPQASSFFQRVMAVPLSKKGEARPPPVKPPAPIRVPKQKRIKGAFEREVDDLFEVILSGKTAGDPSHQQQQFFQKNLKKLSGPQLKKLLKRIHKIRNRYLAPEEKGEEAVEYLNQLLQEKQRQSELNFQWLADTVQRKIEEMDIEKINLKKGRVDTLKHEGRRWKFHEFVGRAFKEEVEWFEHRLESGEIILPRADDTGERVVRRIVNRVLKKQFQASE